MGVATWAFAATAPATTQADSGWNLAQQQSSDSGWNSTPATPATPDDGTVVLMDSGWN
ncbi:MULTISPECIES: hypothetical protein [unclassified Kitasatospora]|uniref:hypothetical protein n=1 Tax=unclassified Kitasatospora TaxID=2633591 RepID=UPI00247691B9|nr:hypothetical protein [Kitasatospora sp. MAP12-44]